MREKRQHFRERLLRPIRVHVLPPEGEARAAPHEALIVDLSLSGALLYSALELAPEAALELELPLDGEQTARVAAEVVRCTVRRSERGYGWSVAVQFREAVPETQMILARNILFTFSSVIHSHMN
jgi:hypothetical protein